MTKRPQKKPAKRAGRKTAKPPPCVIPKTAVELGYLCRTGVDGAP